MNYRSTRFRSRAVFCKYIQSILIAKFSVHQACNVPGQKAPFFAGDIRHDKFVALIPAEEKLLAVFATVTHVYSIHSPSQGSDGHKARSFLSRSSSGSGSNGRAIIAIASRRLFFGKRFQTE